MRDWKKICHQCAEGEIFPDFCPYYGEPCGCNCPQYHQHPEDLPNTAVLAEAIKSLAGILEGRYIQDDFIEGSAIASINDIVQDAIRVQPRNCDRFGGDKDKLIEACMRERGLLVTEDFSRVFADWLLETYHPKEEDNA